jgi:ATP-dependent helicase HrpB
MAAVIARALRDAEGDVLVFLPGAGEIRRVQELLADAGLPTHVHVLPLFGDLTPEEQDRAISPSPPGQRKIVLATNIAETSLTIEGVRVVVDSGLERRPRFDPLSGMSRLDTVAISRASANQRRGRAGRLGPGICHRLWTEAEQRRLAAHAPPEIVETDLASLALELACWGANDATALPWLDPPPAAAMSQAQDLLRRLGALDQECRVTPQGRAMAALGAHPRLAHMLLQARDAGLAATGCTLAALLTERDVLRGPAGRSDADLRTRLELFAERPRGGAVQRKSVPGSLHRAVDYYRRQLGVGSDEQRIDAEAAGWLLAQAYPDRIGRWREPKSGRYQLTGGRGAFFAEPQALAGAEFLVIPELDAGEREARIFLAAPLAVRDIEEHFGGEIETSERVYWDSREQAVLARHQRRLGALVLSDAPLSGPDSAAVTAAVLEGIRELGLESLPWDKESRQWQARVQFARGVEPQGRGPWPDVSDTALRATLETWLTPWLAGVSRRDHFARIDLRAALRSLLSGSQQRRLDELAPAHLAAPSGSRIAIDYLDESGPSVAVRLQEVFGLKDTPRIGGGRVPVTMKLLSPAQRPMQVTRDLQSFWEKGYHEVRKELKGRYPKHYWPEDPWQAQPTRRVRPK